MSNIEKTLLQWSLVLCFSIFLVSGTKAQTSSSFTSENYKFKAVAEIGFLGVLDHKMEPILIIKTMEDKMFYSPYQDYL